MTTPKSASIVAPQEKGTEDKVADVTMDSIDISIKINPDDSIVVSSANESFEKPMAKKRIKLSKEDSARIKAEKEKLREERIQLQIEKEKAKLELEKVRIEKEKMKMEREKQILEEREKKQNELQMKMQMKEKLRKEREEEKARKQKQLEEKQAIIEEENKKKELAKLTENKKLEKSRAFIMNFLKKPNTSFSENSDPNTDMNRTLSTTDNEIDCGEEYLFVPENLFNSFDPDQFDRSIINQNESIENLYLACLLSGKKVPYQSIPNIQSSSINGDDELPEQYHLNNYIYLKFYENLKPPYFGPKPLTTEIDGRRPFIKLESLDYEVDSDEEWDEGGPGESLSNTDSEPEEKDDYEIDNEFFVPHGYLSDDEFNMNSDLAINNDNNDKSQKNTGPLTKEQTLLNERNRIGDKLAPQMIGCFWTSTSSSLEQQLFGQDKLKFLEQFKICPIPLPPIVSKQ
ncbi:Chromatin assembly factor 1, subunit A [Dermatophagoides pteronyssinus]|uniref:Chromatin assembly factor 1, subunit A n=1 Tax=Dermatophagoides pteronyssinus TaxID=6956 RepID=A0ABQ8IYT6_DERPT|nr:Chromatin assembly factor 1, subunit A [Dermatophagoides pteronyssinus]